MFVNPDRDLLLTTNTNAGTTLRQVAFDKSVQRHLGSALFQDRVEKYRKDRDLPPDTDVFGEGPSQSLQGRMAGSAAIYS